MNAARTTRYRPPFSVLTRQQPIDDEASWDSAREYAQRVPEKYLECRVRLRHAWRPRSATPHTWGFEIVERCTDCGSTCEYSINQRGLLVTTRKINYSEGYQNTKGEGRIVGEALGAVRLEWITRKMPTIGRAGTGDE